MGGLPGLQDEEGVLTHFPDEETGLREVSSAFTAVPDHCWQTPDPTLVTLLSAPKVVSCLTQRARRIAQNSAAAASLGSRCPIEL